MSARYAIGTVCAVGFLLTIFAVPGHACQASCVVIQVSSSRFRLLDFEGAPMRGARIRVRSAAKDAPGLMTSCGRRGPIVREFTTDKKGDFSLSGLRSGDYWITYMDAEHGESFFITLKGGGRKRHELSIDHLSGNCYLIDIERNATKPPIWGRDDKRYLPVRPEGEK